MCAVRGALCFSTLLALPSSHRMADPHEKWPHAACLQIVRQLWSPSVARIPSASQVILHFFNDGQNAIAYWILCTYVTHIPPRPLYNYDKLIMNHFNLISKKRLFRRCCSSATIFWRTAKLWTLWCSPHMLEWAQARSLQRWSGAGVEIRNSMNSMFQTSHVYVPNWFKHGAFFMRIASWMHATWQKSKRSTRWLKLDLK